ncbi:CAP domain-containing protein [Ferrimonas pelagia]|uniref:CAP domain-containing protein n=2 Tax=Ferrimonas pelagia TaxID=1177826 RepID=A0ABP9FIU6_9GAMM
MFGYVVRSLLLTSLLLAPPIHANTLTLSAIEHGILTELNFARSDPYRYADEVLEPMLQYYREGKIWDPPWFNKQPGHIQVITTHEGVEALLEAIEAMRSAEPVRPLTPSYGLTLAAREHAAEQGKYNLTGHIGRDGSTPEQRIARYGRWSLIAGENLFYGNSDVNAARHVVMGLIIDDGVADRGHRKLIMDGRYQYVGIVYAPHPSFGFMSAQSYAGQFHDH